MILQKYQPHQVVNTPFLFLTGKGGVGKTSTACATAVALADRGKKVLLLSTDPASNLQDVFGLDLTSHPVPVPDVANLFVSNIDPVKAAEAYREKVVGPYRDKFPADVVATMEEQLSGACTVEIAAFDEFTNVLTNPSIMEQYDHIIFDTAPTGHTLRLLQLPMAWNGFLEKNTHGASCLGALSGLADKKDIYSKSVTVLSDPAQTQLLMVARPDVASIAEAGRASAELKGIGIFNQVLIINGLLRQFTENDEISSSFYKRQLDALKQIPENLKQTETYYLPFVSYSLTGAEHLRQLLAADTVSRTTGQINGATETYNGLEELVENISARNISLIFTMGKGGVGKTTIAAAIAAKFVEQGNKVHLTTTDPAAHIKHHFESENLPPNLTLSNIDPKEEVEKYKQEVILNASKELDEEALAYLQEELNSPCTEEIAVFRAFADVVAQSENEIVIIDTAPTGHTLLLLDAAQSYSKELARSTGEVPESVYQLLPKLRNPKETAVVIVTLAEATPVLEASRLQDDLIRANIQPAWWVINQSLFVTNTKDPILREKADTERKWIREIHDHFAENYAVIPWKDEDNIGNDTIKDSVMGPSK